MGYYGTERVSCFMCFYVPIEISGLKLTGDPREARLVGPHVLVCDINQIIGRPLQLFNWVSRYMCKLTVVILCSVLM